MDQDTIVKLCVFVFEISLFVLLCYILIEDDTTGSSGEVDNKLDITPELLDKAINTPTIPIGYYDILLYNPKLLIALIIFVVIILFIMYYTLDTAYKKKHKPGNNN